MGSRLSTHRNPQWSEDERYSIPTPWPLSCTTAWRIQSMSTAPQISATPGITCPGGTTQNKIDGLVRRTASLCLPHQSGIRLNWSGTRLRDYKTWHVCGPHRGRRTPGVILTCPAAPVWDYVNLIGCHATLRRSIPAYLLVYGTLWLNPHAPRCTTLGLC